MISPLQRKQDKTNRKSETVCLPNNGHWERETEGKETTVAIASKLNYSVYVSCNYCFLKYSPSLENAEHFTQT